jgi:hypothetical protein
MFASYGKSLVEYTGGRGHDFFTARGHLGDVVARDAELREEQYLHLTVWVRQGKVRFAII